MAISFVNAGAQVANNSSPQTPVLPTNHAKDDWLLMFCIQSSASGVTFGPPAGWTSIARNSNATQAMTIEVYAKLDNGSETNPSVTCSAATAGWAVQIGAWRGVNRTTAEDQTEVLSNAAAAQTFLPTGITTLTNAAWVISFVGSKDDNALGYSVVNGFTDRMSGANYDATVGNGSDYSVGIADKEIATAGPATCPTWNQSVNGNDAWVALTLALKPANDIAVTPGLKSLALTAFVAAVVVTANILVTPGVKALTTTKFAPTVATPRLMTPGVKALTTAAFAPTVATPRAMTPAVLALTTAKFAPTVAVPRAMTPGVLALTTTWFAPSVATPRLMTPGLLPLVLTEFPPTVVAGGGGGNPITVIPGTAALVIAGYAPGVFVPRLVLPVTISVQIAPFAPGVSTPRAVTPGVAALTTVQYAPVLVVSLISARLSGDHSLAVAGVGDSSVAVAAAGDHALSSAVAGDHGLTAALAGDHSLAALLGGAA